MNSKYSYVVISLALSLICIRGYSQSNTRGVSVDTSKTAVTHKLLLIPFNTKMCMSEIGKEVNASTHLSYDEITQQFRSQLDLAVYLAFKKNYAPVSLLQGKYRSDSVLNYIYTSTSYKYDLVPGATADAGAKDKNKTGRYVQNGQLEVPVDYSARFMNISVTDAHLLTNLYKRYHTEAFVFINELDIKNVSNQTENLSDDTYRRQVDVHFSIIDKEGKSIAKGLASTYFPFRENDPKQIGEKYFSLVANAIVKDYAQGLLLANSTEQKKQAMQSKSTVSPK